MSCCTHVEVVYCKDMRVERLVRKRHNEGVSRRNGTRNEELGVLNLQGRREIQPGVQLYMLTPDNVHPGRGATSKPWPGLRHHALQK
jgi:hypothetical protein